MKLVAFPSKKGRCVTRRVMGIKMVGESELGELTTNSEIYK
jgi:hypothetical protein